MNLQKWWRIYPLKYKAISALISILALGFGLFFAFVFHDFLLTHGLFEIKGIANMNDVLYWSAALVVIVGLPFIFFAYLDWSRKRVRSGDIEIDARLKDAVSTSKIKR